MERAQSAAGWHPSLDEQSLLVQIWGNFTNRYHEPGLAMSEDLFNALPLELQLHIADAVGERCDRAALALASPRLLGLAACRELPSYQGLEMSLAFHVVLGGVIDEQLLRTYASRSVANARKLRRRLKWLDLPRPLTSGWNSAWPYRAAARSGTSCSRTARSARCW